MRTPRTPRDISSSEHTEVLECGAIKKRVAVIKPTSNECCSNGFAEREI